MRLPRQVPRLDGSLQGTTDREPDFAQHPQEGSQAHPHLKENHPDDPAGLIGAIFDGHRFAGENPATVILAWLAVLPHSIEPPDAARLLLQRLARRDPALLSDQQRQVLDLLAFVGRHCCTRVPESIDN